MTIEQTPNKNTYFENHPRLRICVQTTSTEFIRHHTQNGPEVAQFSDSQSMPVMF